MMFAWTDDIDKLVLDAWYSGKTALQIGNMIGTSRNSVVGRVRRLTHGLLKGKPTKVMKARAKVEKPKPQVQVKKAKRNGKPPIIDAHPAFDPTDGIWFLEDGTEAKSIKELLAKLPQGSTIKDYMQRC